MYLISILGPTGVGKTRISLLLAYIFNIEIISSDSRQCYKEINVGSASPKNFIINIIHHNFIKNLSLWETYSVGDYQIYNLKILNEFFTRFPIVLIVGGAGLYSNIIIYGLNKFPLISKEINKDLYIYIYKKLQNNCSIFIHYLKILRYFKIFSSYKEKGIITSHSFYKLNIGINTPKDDLYNCINHRVDMIMKCGFLEEAQECYHSKCVIALQSIGYRNIFNIFDGKKSFKKAFKEIKNNTRHYSKRQHTWYKKDIKNLWFFTFKEYEIIKNLRKNIFIYNIKNLIFL